MQFTHTITAQVLVALLAATIPGAIRAENEIDPTTIRSESCDPTALHCAFCELLTEFAETDKHDECDFEQIMKMVEERLAPLAQLAKNDASYASYADLYKALTAVSTNRDPKVRKGARYYRDAIAPLKRKLPKDVVDLLQKIERKHMTVRNIVGAVAGAAGDAARKWVSR